MSSANDHHLQRLAVTPDGHYLQHKNGKPFFFLGDTAWELFHRLTLEEAKHYLKTRAEQGFNVIQAVLLAEFDGLTEPNRKGDLPLHDLDPTRPNEAYFAHVDEVMHYAAQLGLFMGVLPTWGDKVNKKWGTGPEVFTPKNARVYGEWLGKRYRNFDPLLWINGGDRSLDTPEHFATFRALAEGLQAGDESSHIITFHPMGGRHSSTDLHNDKWLAFNMIQSGHGARDIDNAAMVEADYHLKPTKPTLDAEFNYENHAINWKPDTSRFRDYDVRKSAYRSLFAGGCGITYGCQDIWQFLDTSRHKPVAFADTPWREALHFSGAYQMHHLRKLMESLPFSTGAPAQDRIVGEAHGVRVSTGKGYLLAYLPTGGKVTLKLGGKGKAHWFDPRSGVTLGEVDAHDTHTFTAPTQGVHNDWVLVFKG